MGGIRRKGVRLENGNMRDACGERNVHILIGSVTVSW